MKFIDENKDNENFEWFMNLFVNQPGNQDEYHYQPDYVGYDGEDWPEEGILVKMLYTTREVWAEDMGVCGTIHKFLLYVPEYAEYIGVYCEYDSWGGETTYTYKQVFEVSTNVYAPRMMAPTPVLIGM